MSWLPAIRLCHCGSGLTSTELYDARGIYVSRVCEECEAGTKAKFRPEIFADSHYECDEPIEEEA